MSSTATSAVPTNGILIRRCYLGLRSDDGAAALLFDLKIAAGVITMVMGVKDMGNLPALAAVVANSGSTPAGRRHR